MASALGLLALLSPLALAAVGDLPVFPDCVNGPLRNYTICDISATPLARATALVNLLTLEEKLNSTGDAGPGVPRLGLPVYEWWQEGLHGITRLNFATSGNYSYATSFPQPILMGAAFDDQLITDVATVVSTEARVYNNDGRAGLDYWTPNINPYRDPRWGRGQETPGEDPFHLSSYVHALIDGLQGGYDPKYKRVVATCKHFAGYDIESWNGNFRYQWDAPISSQDLSEYYLPSFQSCARDSNVGAFMCSYNAVNGVPTCADPYLLQDILRDHWGWTNEEQWVVSDCDAVQNVFLPHEWAPTREQAVADALNAGTDINCGTYYQDHLPAAFAQGLFNESTLDRALIRQYSSLIRVGYFDPPALQPYRQLDFSAVNTAHAQSLAYTAAAKGIVLLKNDGLLPLSLPQIQNTSIALIGDWANATTQMQGNYYGQPPYLVSPLAAAQDLGLNVTYSAGPTGQGDPTTNAWLPMWSAAANADLIVYVGGIDNTVESEGMDRVSIAWTGAQLDAIGQLAALGKPTLVVQMGGGQIDSSPLVSNPNISALVWGGYPGQSGGKALWDILTGVVAPAGRLPVTQYPAHYIHDVPMTDMSLRPSESSPGRTYQWYNGTPVFEFGSGLHYTTFSASIAAPAATSFDIQALISACAAANATKYLDQCSLPGLAPLSIAVQNTGATATSDYVTLAFLAGTFGPAPHPKKKLVAYTRLSAIAPNGTATAELDLTLGSLARADEMGNKVLYPGSYRVLVDVQPLAVLEFEVSGREAVLDEWPQPPAGGRRGSGVQGVEGYFVGGYGSAGEDEVVL